MGYEDYEGPGGRMTAFGRADRENRVLRKLKVWLLLTE